jgi:hypothetical protein
MENKYLKFLIIVLAVAIIVPQIALAVWWNPMSWGWLNRIFHFQRTEQKQEQSQNNPQIIGGDKDAHGCLGSAGYTWCEVKQKCLRQWEEKCQSNNSFQYSVGDNYANAKKVLKQNGWLLVVPNKAPIDSNFPEISDCGSGRDAICTVDFKKGADTNHLNVQSVKDENGNFQWIVVGSE